MAAKAIMLQGTMSNAGKSILSAALCRIFAQDGYRVAPFKSQNMALNSYITADGLEIGRAQAMQAEAAGVEPDARMNPILLKPTTDTGSQVIVNGEVRGTASAAQYYKRRAELIPVIKDAYSSLAEQNDIIVIEGAGSPAEINLKENDIVNMGMAKIARAPVLLAGDIDRGGVFAQLAGTLMLLEKDEKEYIKGLIINKFRGDKSLLTNGINMIEEICAKPVIGVVPYINMDIDDEDSLTERFEKSCGRGLINIAVIRLPKISNFTDFAALERTKGASLCYVSSVRELAACDLIIIPGTKNTIEDMLWMRRNGIEAAILKHASRGGAVMGICGGYQILGEYIDDPHGAERGGGVRGMGLLPVSTVFETKKNRTRVHGVIQNAGGVFKALNGGEFDGYEIHMGASRIVGDAKPLTRVTNAADGSERPDGACRGNIYGTYVHGIFDGELAGRLTAALMEEKGIDASETEIVNARDFKKRQYNILADAVRESLDIKKIYDIIKKGA